MITEYLIQNHGFRKTLKKRELDLDQFTCVKRISENHYLFYSEEMKYFDLGMMHSKPKGRAGGGFDQFIKITIPKLINSEKDAEELILGTSNQLFIKTTKL